LDFGKFLVELIGRIQGSKRGKKALFLQTKGGFEEQKLGGQAGRKEKAFTTTVTKEHEGIDGTLIFPP
jgi:hypothetical protein